MKEKKTTVKIKIESLAQMKSHTLRWNGRFTTILSLFLLRIKFIKNFHGQVFIFA
jgi:hypothetical protein